MRREGDRIELYFNRWKYARLSLTALIFVAMGILVLVIPSPNPGVKRPVGTGLLAIALGGLLGILPISRVLRKRPALILDSTGLTDLSQRKDWFIPWSDIGAIYRLDMLVSKYVMITPADQDKYRATMHPMAVRLSGNQPLSRPLLDIELNTKKLEAMIVEMWHKHRNVDDPSAPPRIADYPRFSGQD